MACLALAPVAGAVLVWGPAVVFLVLEGHWGKAFVLVTLGVLAIVIVDNLLRPVLVGKQLQTHTVLVFISVVGGMMLYGPSGTLLGPIVLTVTQVLLESSRKNQV
jgi:predicted PurR-regulated permease PerM